MAQLVEHDLAKVGAAGSSPVSRSKEKGMIPKGIVPFFESNSGLEVRVSTFHSGPRKAKVHRTLRAVSRS